MYATCETPDCANAWIPVTVTGEYLVICGVCGYTVTNVADVKTEEGMVLPEWILEMLEQQNSSNSND